MVSVASEVFLVGGGVVAGRGSLPSLKRAVIDSIKMFRRQERLLIELKVGAGTEFAAKALTEIPVSEVKMPACSVLLASFDT